jgi:hypothetical protein
MATDTGKQAPSQGICHFCQGEFAKNKMAQHLKSCKARAEQEASQAGEKMQLLHLQIEGKYRPEYWMHLEIPAEATLADLDDFLRAVWVECCDHLSQFTIDGVSYTSMAEGAWTDELTFLDAEQEGEDEQGEDQLPSVQGELPALAGPDGMASWLTEELHKEFQTDLQDVPVDDIEQKLEQMFAESLPAGLSNLTMSALKPMLHYMAEALQAGTLADDLEEFETLADEDEDEDDEMLVQLGKVLQVGDRFSYVYDFGSNTTLNLRVVDEREGAMLLPEDADGEGDGEPTGEDEDEVEELSITLLALNKPPALLCSVCRQQPAAYISSVEEHMPVAQAVFCQDCAQKQDAPDELLPVVNSPRVGICGYTGDDEAGDDDVTFADEEQ